MAQPSISPFTGTSGKPSLHRILVNVGEGENEIPQPVEYMGMEALSPDMTGKASLFIVRHSEYAEDPLHDPGKRFILRRFDQEMDVIAHDTEVPDPEQMPPFCLDYNGQEEILDRSVIKEHLLAVDACGHVVPGAFSELAGLPHIRHTHGL